VESQQVSPSWPCDHDVPPAELRRARRSCAGYFEGGTVPADVSPQLLTTLAYLMGVAGGIECARCRYLTFTASAARMGPNAGAIYN
jgi:hypothetical protein